MAGFTPLRLDANTVYSFDELARVALGGAEVNYDVQYVLYWVADGTLYYHNDTARPAISLDEVSWVPVEQHGSIELVCLPDDPEGLMMWLWADVAGTVSWQVKPGVSGADITAESIATRLGAELAAIEPLWGLVIDSVDAMALSPALPARVKSEAVYRAVAYLHQSAPRGNIQSQALGDASVTVMPGHVNFLHYSGAAAALAPWVKR